ncbi:MAG: S8 family serine peptidase [Fimbriimonadia bacterium]
MNSTRIALAALRRGAATTAAVALLCLAHAQFNARAQTPTFEYVPGEMLIKFRQGTTPERMQCLAGRLGGSLLPSIPDLGIYKIKLAPTANVVGLSSWLRFDPSVEFAEPNGIVRIAWPDDEFYGLQWGLPKVGWPAAMDTYQGKSSVIIAICDTGIALSHPDLQSKIINSGWDFVNNDAVAEDDHKHGTHVAGIAAAATNNATGIAGMNPTAMLLPVKILNASGNGTWENVANGINYSVNNGAHVINMSLAGTAVPPASVLTAVQYAVASGVLVVVAAGNNNSYFPTYPASFVECIAVASSTSGDFRAGSSNFNQGDYQWVDVAAPGTSIYSCFLGGTYGYDSGTSMATPHVSAEAALLYSVLTEPRTDTPRSPEAASLVRQLIESNCHNVGSWVTYGRIKLDAALNAALNLPAAISGTLTLQGHVAPQTVPITIQLFEPGTSNLVASKPIALDEDGSYSATFTVPGTYDVRFSASSKFLARRVPNVGLSRVAAASTVDATLLNGDADGTGAVDIADLNIILLQFAGAGSGDLNGDGVVDLLDLSIALVNFTKTSDP